MRVLIGCEFSGKVRDAFRSLGHDAYSCDLDDSDNDQTYHIKDNILNHLDDGWDMMVVFPPCTHLAVSGARHFHKKEVEQRAALEFVRILMNANINKIALENPIGVISTRIRKPDQIIEPWQYGHGETKSTCLWLKNLPKLIPTNIVDGRFPATHYMGFYKAGRGKLPKGKRLAKLRSITYDGIAKAMAEQWGSL